MKSKIDLLNFFPDTTEIYDSIERLQIGINTTSLFLVEQGGNYKGSMHKVTPELYNDLKENYDNPEFEEKLFNGVTPIIKGYGIDTPFNVCSVFVSGDYYSDEAREFVKLLKVRDAE